MSKHTPGVWEACSNVVRTKRNADGSGGFLVCECPANTEHGIADAAFIAAAPEMLEAANYALEVLNRGRGKQATLRAIERLQAAIAKATGAEPARPVAMERRFLEGRI